MSSAGDLASTGDLASDLRERKKDSLSKSKSNGFEKRAQLEQDNSKEKDRVTRGKAPDGTGTYPLRATPHTSVQRTPNA